MRIVIIGFALLVAATASAQPLSTAITYQGELEFESQPAQGIFDFEFLVFDAASSGTLITTLVVEDVLVQAGLFSVELDFGPGVFIGEDRWLELGVRAGASTGGFTGLLPRQALTPAPFALHAEGVAAEAIGTIEIEDGSITADDLGSGAVGAVAVNDAEVQLRVTGSCPAGQAMVSVGQDGVLACAPTVDSTLVNGPDPVGSVQNLSGVQVLGTNAWLPLGSFSITSGNEAGEIMAMANALAGCIGCGQGEFRTCEITILEESDPSPPNQGESAAFVFANLFSNIPVVLEFQQAADTTVNYLIYGRVGSPVQSGEGCTFVNITAAGVFQPK